MRLELDKDDQRERIQRARLIINEYNQHALEELEHSGEPAGEISELFEKNLSTARRTATSLSSKLIQKRKASSSFRSDGSAAMINAKDILLTPFTFSFERMDALDAIELGKIEDPLR